MGLTDYFPARIIAPSAPHVLAGRRNPIRLGQKRPLLNAVFFCHSFWQALLKRLLTIMARYCGQRSALAAPSRGFRPHFNAPPNTVESIRRRYPSLRLGTPK